MSKLQLVEGSLLDDTALDIDSLIDEVEEADLDASVLDHLNDERDFKPAANVVKFITDPNYMYLGADPFPKQVELLVKTLEEWCPSKKCTDRAFWRNVPVDVPLHELYDRVSFLEHGVCPKCGRKKVDLQNKGRLNGVVEVVAAIGMRGSKTTTVAGMLAPYILHRMITLPTDPSRYYGLLRGKSLHMSFVAITAGQAAETLWAGFKDSLDQSEWFIRYFDYLEEKGKMHGTELLSYKQTFLWLPTKRLMCNYLPANMRTMRGRTRFFSAIDELGWFSNDEGRIQANATETYEALRKSMRTIRSACATLTKRGVNNVPNGLMANVGSPYEANDKIMELLRGSAKLKTRVGFHFATWEFNPTIREDDADMVEERMDKGELIFMRDYGAEPPMAANPLIGLKASDLLEMVDNPDRVRLFEAKQIEVVRKQRRYCAAELFNQIADNSRARIVTVDAGEKQNAFSISIGSIDFENDAKISLDAAIEVKPSRKLNVSFPTMLDLLIDQICQVYNVLFVIYDRWQATHHIQRINDTEFPHIREGGPIAERHSLTFNELCEVRDTIYSLDRISLPQPRYIIDEQDVLSNGFDRYKQDPISHLMVQMLTVRQFGTRIVKPVNGDDDLFRTFALLVNYLLREEIVEELRRYSVAGGKRASLPLGLVGNAKYTLGGKATRGSSQSSSVGLASGIQVGSVGRRGKR